MKRSVVFVSIIILVLPCLGWTQIFDPILEISGAAGYQGFSQVVYNSIENEYCVVWEDGRTYDSTKTDIYGQILKADGSRRGGNFAVCTDSMQQYWPHLDFDPVTNRYLVVFSDNRNASTENWLDNYDVYAALLDKDGRHIWTSGCEDDSCFGVTKNMAAIHYPDVAFNHASRSYLVVWADYRNPSGDIYGQRVNADGELLESSAGIVFASVDPTVNFPICLGPNNNQDVPVVSYSHAIQEWLVVFAQCEGMSQSSIQAQRVNRFGKLLKRDGTAGVEQIMVFDNTHLDKDPAQPRVQFNSEFTPALQKSVSNQKLCEALITWQDNRGMNYPDAVNIYGQRLAFYPDAEAVSLGLKSGVVIDSLFFAAALQVDGIPTMTELPNYPVSDADRGQNAPYIAYSSLDNEYIIGWGDLRRTGDWMNPDFYVQRLKINAIGEMLWLGLTESDTVQSWENIPVDTSDNYEGGNLVGAAHNSRNNEFLVTFGYKDVSLNRSADVYGRRISFSTGSDVADAHQRMNPETFHLSQNFPNPFNPGTTIEFSIPHHERVRVEIVNILGANLSTLLNEKLAAGTYRVKWNGTDRNGLKVPSGIYLYRIDAGTHTLTKKMMLLR